MNVKYQPYKTLLIRDLVHFSINDLILFMTTTDSHGVFWANGIVFNRMDVLPSEITSREEYMGQKTYETVIYAELPIYEKIIKNKENMALYVINTSNNLLSHYITKYIKENSKKTFILKSKEEVT